MCVEMWRNGGRFTRGRIFTRAETRRTELRRTGPRRAELRRGELGNATIEFVGILVIIVLPALVLIASLATITSAQFAAQAAARDSARELVRAQSFSVGHSAALDASATAWSARGLDGQPSLTIECDRTPCLSPGATVSVTVSAEVNLPFIGISVEVSDTQTMAAGEFRAVRP